MANLYHLAYVSTQTQEFHLADLIHLLNGCRAENEQRNVTGLLMYRGDSFFQILEGEYTDVQFVFDRIKADTKHTDIDVLLDESVEERVFPEWRMGFMYANNENLSRYLGCAPYREAAEESRTVLTKMGSDPRLLDIFREVIGLSDKVGS